MTDDFITLSRQRAASLLVEIAELRSQITDLTKDRDKCQNEAAENMSFRIALRAENTRLYDKIGAIESVCECCKAGEDGGAATIEALIEDILKVIRTEAQQ